MIYSYFKIAFRSLWKNKLFSFINIAGLGMAIPFALLSLLHLQSTFEFDNFHKDPDRIYRIVTDEKTNEGSTISYASSPFLLAENLHANYPGIEQATKVVRDFGWELNNQLKVLDVNMLYVEPAFFEIFNFGLETGTLPLEPNTLVLTHEMAERFFNQTDPTGKILTHPTYGAFKVTGVLKPFKKQTQFRSDVMVSMATYRNIHPEASRLQSWAAYESHTFAKLQANTNSSLLDAALGQIAQKTNPDIAFARKKHVFRKQSLAAISPSEEDLRNNPYVDKWSDIYFNFTIPLMILLLAGFNYTNLTLARSLSRSKEVGVRKVMGAVRMQLIVQFVCEAVVVAFLSLLVGMIILYLMKQTIHVQWLTWEVDNEAVIWFVFIVFALFLGITAGSLPAWILSSFQPVHVLKGTLLPASFGKAGFRKSLIVIQFIVTLGFIFQIGHMYNQFNYMATENENFNRKGIFNISLPDNKYPLLVNDLVKNKDVENVGLASMPFGGVAAEYAIKAHATDENQSAYYYAANRNFIENMKLTLVAGQNLPDFKSDSATGFVLINEKAVQNLRLGTPRDAIGKRVILNNQTEAQVVGVVKNFCHFNYQFKIEPLVFQYNPARFQVLVVKTTDRVSQGEFVAAVQALWKKHYPYQQMSYAWFESDLYDRYYPAEDMKMMGMASMVIFVIALMGLLGMVIYNSEKRVKEVGIRKVMGASVGSIVKILSWSFMKLLLIAGIVAWPVGYLGGLLFHSVFTFHTGINYLLMVLFFAIVLVFALFTVVYFAIRTAVANPVNSLRSE